jgi:transcription initiation factor TFIIIB Brf1 subunit/transcription initiation factor TFIIB
MDAMDKYLDMSDDQIDNLILGVNLESKIDSNNNKICINCKSDELVVDNIKGHVVCSMCGVINGEYLDEKPEFSNDSEGGNARYGCPSNYFLPQSSLGTKIKSKGYNKLSFIQKQGQMPYKEKSLLEVLERIQYKCKKYNITQTIIDSAKILYKKVSESVHSKGKRKGKNIIMRCINRRSMIAACLFYACKIQKETRSPKEVADIYDLEIKNVNRGCRNFCDIIDTNTIFYQIKSSQSVDFIERFGKKLNMSKQFIDIAKDVSTNIHKLDIASTHEPPSVAAGCIVLVTTVYNLEISKKDISDVFSISDVTISKTYRKIFPYHKILLCNKITDLILEKKNTMVKASNIDKSNLIILNDTESPLSSVDSENVEDTEDYEAPILTNTKTKKTNLHIVSI